MNRKQGNSPFIHHGEYHTLIGYFIIAIPLVIAFFSVDIHCESVLINILIVLLKICFIIALAIQLKEDYIKRMIIKFDLIEIVCLSLAVLFTYALNHYLSIDAVLAASLVGMLGYLLGRKYQVVIYCGAFAGMVSLTLFNFFEVAILALVCSFLFTLTKQAMSGYGGKLGFVAFMSSFVIHTLFNDAYVPGSVRLNIYILMIAALLGGLSTYLIHTKIKNTSNVLASSLPTLVVSIFMLYVFKGYVDYLPMFFAGTFVGMTSKTRLNNLIYIVLACVILAYIYVMFENSFIGLGGKLGFMAIFSVLIMSGVRKVYSLIKGKVI